MNRAAALVTVAALLAFPNVTAAQTLSLLREEAARQIIPILSNKEHLIIKTFTIKTQVTRKLVGAKVAIENQSLYLADLIKYLTTVDDQDVRNWISQNKTDPLLSCNCFFEMNDPIVWGLRDTWKAGLIDHFTVNLQVRHPDKTNWPFSEDLRQKCLYPNMALGADNQDGSRGAMFVCNLTVDIFGVVKDEKLCASEPASVPAGFAETQCNVVIAQRELTDVTGITSAFYKGREIKIVEFDEQIEPTAAGKLYTDTRAAIKPARAFFLLYDDGWRIAKIFPYPLILESP